MSTSVTYVVVACAMIVNQLSSDPGVEKMVEEIEQSLDDLHEEGKFDGVILITRGEEVLLSSGYGFADREAKISWDVDTLSSVGSNTKQYTAAAILHLCENEEMQLNDALSKFFDDVPADKQEITVHQLLTHTSGMPQDLGRDDVSIDRDDYLQLAWNTPLQTKPGEKHSYSNAGYSLLAAIIEKVAGIPYEIYLKRELLDPAGMTRTGYHREGWKELDQAIGYRPNGSRWGTILEKQTQGFSWHLMGNGGIHSTPREHRQWIVALKAGKILKPESVRLMFSPHARINENFAYGYGWYVYELGGVSVEGHSGSNGFLCATARMFPETDGVGLVIFSNEEAMMRTARREVERIAVEYLKKSGE